MRILRARAIIAHEGKFLFVRLNIHPDFWCLPGGRMEDGEQPEEALKRELIEELGVPPKIGQLLFVHQFQDGEVEQLEFIFNIDNPEDYKSINLTNTSHGIKELAEVTFIDPSTEFVLPKFLPDELSQFNPNDLRKVKFFSYIK